MLKRSLLSKSLVALCVVGAFVAGAGSAAAEPVKLRAGWVLTPASLLPLMLEKQGLAKHNGVSYQLEPVRVQASPLQITGLASGDLDIGTLGYSSLSFAILNAGLKDIKVLADEIQDGYQDYASFKFVVKKDSPMQKVADLKGKVLAVNGIGTGVDMAMSAMLRKHGLQKKDYTTLEIGFPNMKTVLAEGKADMVTAVVPFSEDPELQAMSRILFSSKDSMGTSALSFMVARSGFIAKNRKALVDFMEDYLRVVRWYSDPANHKEAVEIVSRVTKIPPERFDSWLFTKKDYYRDQDGLPNLVDLQRNIKVQKSLGLIKADVDVPKFADLSLVKEAAKRLK
ncbi:MAG: ABC transporter substrate-binding protein [Betaproteobacteria bacterium]|nr:ABC transporter substrate-binding protein [Betaproteobacteria bacterium]